MLKQKATLIARIVYLVDLALTTLAFFSAFFLRNLIFPLLDPGRFPTGLYPLREYLKVFPIVLIIWSVLLFTYHSYHSHRTIPVSREALTILRVVVVGNVILATLAYLIPLRQLTRAWFILFGRFSALFLIVETIAVAGRRAIEVARTIEGHKYWGYKILGFVSDGHRLSNGWARYRIFGTVPELRALLEKGLAVAEPIDEIVFAVTRKK